MDVPSRAVGPGRSKGEEGGDVIHDELLKYTENTKVRENLKPKKLIYALQGVRSFDLEPNMPPGSIHTFWSLGFPQNREECKLRRRGISFQK